MSELSASSEASERIDPPAADQEKKKRRASRLLKTISAVVVAVGLLLLKLKGVLFLLVAKFKLLMVNPLEGFGIAQLAVAGGSMIVSLVAYAMKMGFPFAAGFIIILVVHELGHALMIRAKGLRAGGMVFIPFVGGAVTLRNQPRSAYVDAQIGLAGPIAGTIASVISLQIYSLTGNPLYGYVAFAGFLINLFNLTPIGPLDGGRIAGAITKWMWVFGAAILVVLMVRWKNPFLLLIIVLGVVQIYRTITDQPRKRFYNVSTTQRATVAAVYFALTFFLGYQTVVTHNRLMQ